MLVTLQLPLQCQCSTCLLYTSDAADEEDSVDLGGRRIIKKKKNKKKKKKTKKKKKKFKYNTFEQEHQHTKISTID